MNHDSKANQHYDEVWAARFWESVALARRINRTRKLYRRPLDEQLVGKCIARKAASK